MATIHVCLDRLYRKVERQRSLEDDTRAHQREDCQVMHCVCAGSDDNIGYRCSTTSLFYNSVLSGRNGAPMRHLGLQCSACMGCKVQEQVEVSGTNLISP